MRLLRLVSYRAFVWTVLNIALRSTNAEIQKKRSPPYLYGGARSRLSSIAKPRADARGHRAQIVPPGSVCLWHLRCFSIGKLPKHGKRPESDVPQQPRLISPPPTHLVSPLPCTSPVVPVHPYHGEIVVLRMVQAFSSICVEAMNRIQTRRVEGGCGGVACNGESVRRRRRYKRKRARQVTSFRGEKVWLYQEEGRKQVGNGSNSLYKY